MNAIIDSGNFDVCLFAVDLINFVFIKSSKLSHNLLVASYPKFICKDFSETLKAAVLVIKDSLMKNVDEDFAKFQRQNGVSLNTYIKYSKKSRKVSSGQDLDVKTFLHYSVHVAFMAHRFCNAGVHQAQNLAVSIIADYFQDMNKKDINYSLFEAFDEIAEKILSGTTDTGNFTSSRPLTRNVTADMRCFASPDLERKYICGKKMDVDFIRGYAIDSAVKKGVADSHDLSKSEDNTSDVSSPNSCRWMKDYPKKEYKTTPTLNGSLESSLEQLSALSFNSLKDHDTLKSPPVDSSLRRISGILKKRTPKNSLERQIFKLSPLRENRGKVEWVSTVSSIFRMN